MQPNCSRYVSANMLNEISQKTTWRQYHDSNTDNVNELIEIYLQKHARVKDPIIGLTYPSRPSAIIKAEDDKGNICKGGIFANGATLKLYNKDGIKTVLLIEDVLANRINFPRLQTSSTG